MEHDYLAREAKARVNIDAQLAAAGWQVQGDDHINLTAGWALLFVNFPLRRVMGGSTTCSFSTSSRPE